MNFILISSLFSILLIFGVSQSNADSDIISQDKVWEVPIQFHAIYTESGIETSFLEVGQQAYIVFPIPEPNGRETLQTVQAGYQIVDDKDFPRYDDEMAEFKADSIDISKPLSIPFVPQEPGSYYLRQTVFYEYDHNASGSVGGGNKNFVVVDEFSKALDDEGSCRNSDLLRYQKQDMSNAVCVTHPTFVQLLQRGY